MSKSRGANIFQYKAKLRNIQKVRQFAALAVEPTADDLLAWMVHKGFIPFKDGTLEGDHHVVTGETGIARIVVDTFYAKRLYFHPEFKFRKSPNRYARGLWFEPFMTAKSQSKIPKEFMTYELRLILGKKLRGTKLYKARTGGKPG